MKTFSIKPLLIVIAVVGFFCWFFFVPVQTSISVHPDDPPKIERGDKAILFRMGRLPSRMTACIENTEGTFVEFSDDGKYAVVSMSRLKYLNFVTKFSWKIQSEDEWEKNIFGGGGDLVSPMNINVGSNVVARPVVVEPQQEDIVSDPNN